MITFFSPPPTTPMPRFSAAKASKTRPRVKLRDALQVHVAKKGLFSQSLERYSDVLKPIGRVVKALRSVARGHNVEPSEILRLQGRVPDVPINASDPLKKLIKSASNAADLAPVIAARSEFNITLPERLALVQSKKDLLKPVKRHLYRFIDAVNTRAEFLTDSADTPDANSKNKLTMTLDGRIYTISRRPGEKNRDNWCLPFPGFTNSVGTPSEVWDVKLSSESTQDSKKICIKKFRIYALRKDGVIKFYKVKGLQLSRENGADVTVMNPFKLGISTNPANNRLHYTNPTDPKNKYRRPLFSRAIELLTLFSTKLEGGAVIAGTSSGSGTNDNLTPAISATLSDAERQRREAVKQKRNDALKAVYVKVERAIKKSSAKPLAVEKMGNYATCGFKTSRGFELAVAHMVKLARTRREVEQSPELLSQDNKNTVKAAIDSLSNTEKRALFHYYGLHDSVPKIYGLIVTEFSERVVKRSSVKTMLYRSYKKLHADTQLEYPVIKRALACLRGECKLTYKSNPNSPINRISRSLAVIGAENLPYIHLSERQRKFLSYMVDHPNATREDITRGTNLKPSKATWNYMIKKLADAEAVCAVPAQSQSEDMPMPSPPVLVMRHPREIARVTTDYVLTYTREFLKRLSPEDIQKLKTAQIQAKQRRLLNVLLEAPSPAYAEVISAPPPGISPENVALYQRIGLKQNTAGALQVILQTIEGALVGTERKPRFNKNIAMAHHLITHHEHVREFCNTELKAAAQPILRVFELMVDEQLSFPEAMTIITREGYTHSDRTLTTYMSRLYKKLEDNFASEVAAYKAELKEGIPYTQTELLHMQQKAIRYQDLKMYQPHLLNALELAILYNNINEVASKIERQRVGKAKVTVGIKPQTAADYLYELNKLLRTRK